MKELKVIGTMSGTSLDGLDLVAAKFSFENQWKYELISTKTVSYSEELISRLSNLDSDSAINYEKTNHDLGRFMGEKVAEFIDSENFKPDFIASHGHTIFHQPETYLTTQIGHPAAIRAITETPVIADFRTTDVHLGGQGAPLVPIGDLLLFPEYSHCLNLGGIANISVKNEKEIEAFDICVANMALNYLARKKGMDYDRNGELAASGTEIPKLVQTIVDLDFHAKKAPKSLGKEWFDKELKNILEDHLKNSSLVDVLASVSQAISDLISKHLTAKSEVLITGGGTFNTDLINRIKAKSGVTIKIPSTDLINFKEALIFGFLGVLRWIEEPNILCSVTGVNMNHIGGCIYV